jgi:hypothetical protein
MTRAAQHDLFGGPAPRRFDQDALGFLISFARKHKGQPFSSEQVTLAAIKRGIAPPDLRAWGAIFTQAARAGYIRRSEVLFQRAMGNGSLTPGWIST